MRAQDTASSGFRSRCAIGGERRLSPRVAARLQVDLECAGQPGPLRGILRDVGVGGLCVETRSPFILADIMRAGIAIPNGPDVWAAVEGIWQRDSVAKTGVLTGLRFRDLDKEAERSITSFVERTALETSRFLQACNHLDDLPLSDALDIVFHTRMVEFSQGSVVYSEGTVGTRGDSLFIVAEGSVLLESRRGNGTRIPIERIGVGGLFAGIPFLTGLPHMESAIAASNVTLLEIDPYSFGYMMREKPGVAHMLLRSLLRLRAAQLDSVIGRLAAH